MFEELKKMRFKLSQPVCEMLTLRITLALFLLGRGTFFVVTPEKDLITSKFYRKLDVILDVDIWGLIILINGLIMLSTIFDRGLKGYIAFTIANSIAVGTYVMFSSSGVENGLNLWTPYMYLILATAHFILLATGGYRLWTQRKMTNT
jgi:hypothetical protein